jgi:hypothetical protein
MTGDMYITVLMPAACVIPNRFVAAYAQLKYGAYLLGLVCSSVYDHRYSAVCTCFGTPVVDIVVTVESGESGTLNGAVVSGVDMLSGADMLSGVETGGVAPDCPLQPVATNAMPSTPMSAKARR